MRTSDSRLVYGCVFLGGVNADRNYYYAPASRPTRRIDEERTVNRAGQLGEEGRDDELRVPRNKGFVQRARIYCQHLHLYREYASVAGRALLNTTGNKLASSVRCK
ncbi:hypothetical protein MRX96_011996 [Rhipicephalus microplus]